MTAAPALFRSTWIDDDRLVYQSGAGKQTRIHVYQPATRADLVLKSRAGSALWGFGGVVCPGAPADVAADDGATPEYDEYGSEEAIRRSFFRVAANPRCARERLVHG